MHKGRGTPECGSVYIVLKTLIHTFVLTYGLTPVYPRDETLVLKLLARVTSCWQDQERQAEEEACLYELHTVKAHTEPIDLNIAAGWPRGQHAGHCPRMGCRHCRSVCVTIGAGTNFQARQAHRALPQNRT